VSESSANARTPFSGSPTAAVQASRAALPGDITLVQTLLSADMAHVNATLQRELNSDVPLIGQIGDYLIAAGGKRLRPMLVLLCARALQQSDQASTQDQELAAIIELIHTATLLHDDVVDESAQRRARKTANALWGNAPSVLVGDFLYSRAFQMMVRLGQMPVMRVLADTTNAIAEGEVLQLMHRRNPDVSEARYLEVIRRKTAVLFEAACKLPATLRREHLPNAARMEQQLGDFGMALGCAFQICDDVLDYVGHAEQIGKNLGDDLAEGKSTLPLIFASVRGNAAQAARIRTALECGQREALPELIAILRETDAIDASFDVADRYAERAQAALADLPESTARDALLRLTRFAVRRSN
jgi:octaprenyl-diphosphate synthase